MSHTVTIKTSVTNLDAIRKSCDHMRLEAPVQGAHRLYSGKKVTGTGVKLPDWAYPVVFDAAGVAHYDNFNGHWGDQKHLDAFLQRYAVVVATDAAVEAGHQVEEIPEGQNIRLRITMDEPEQQQISVGSL